MQFVLFLLLKQVDAALALSDHCAPVLLKADQSARLFDAGI